MNTPNLDSFVVVPLPIDLYAEFARRYSGGISSVIEQVAWDFLDRTAEDFNAPSRSSGGVYWESLFLPEGTQVRTKHYSEYKVAEVQGKEIIWKGKVYSSMSQLARAMRGNTSNNAWQVLEIKRPSDTKWVKAILLRK